MAALPVLGASRLEALFEDSARTVLETAALPSFLMNQRWFGGKARGVTGPSSSRHRAVAPAGGWVEQATIRVLLG